MSSLPTGTVTFLFTDIEGSTQLWQQQPAAMREALALHHAILQQAIESQQGHVFQIVGDAFCAAFADAHDALAAALTAQRLLYAAPWPATPLRVRMGVHTGPIEIVDGAYPSSLTLIRVQRIMAAAQGGQVLLSGASEVLVNDRLPGGVTLRDLGERRLKHLDEPERLFQLVAPDLPTEFKSLSTDDHCSNNLPPQLTSFIGREREIGEVKHWLENSRLVTLTGASGSGKTRLALKVAADLCNASPAGLVWPDGTWFVELAALADPAFVLQTIASVLGVSEQSGRPIIGLLTDYLRHKRLLLLLDNCEHLIEACAQLADVLLHAAPDLKILATSREALGIDGEVAWSVPPLQVPAPASTTQRPASDGPGAGAQQSLAIEKFEAVRLFAERAVANQRLFRLTEANTPLIAQICRQLDGMPLAIELAAARVRTLSVEQIADRLNDRFRLLTTGSRTALARHQTLLAAVDWSYDLLSEPERLLMRRLSVFAGGWTLEAAEQVTTEGDNAPPRSTVLRSGDILNLLSHLVDKSLVTAETQADDVPARYRLLETIRQYAHEKLREAGELTPVRERHRAYFLTLTEAAEDAIFGAQQATTLKHLEAEHDNLRAALAASKESAGDSAEGLLRLCGALWSFWYLRGYATEGRQWLSDALVWRSQAAGQVAPEVLVRVLVGAGTLAWAQGDYAAALTYCQEGLQLARALARPPNVAAVAMIIIGLLTQARGDFTTAQALYTEALSILRAAGHKFGIALALTPLADSERQQGHYAHAEALLQESLTLRHEIGDRWGIGLALHQLGLVALDRGDNEQAKMHNEQSLAFFREVGNAWGMARALDILGEIAERQGDLAGADKRLDESLALFQTLEDRFGVALVLSKKAVVANARGDDAGARRLGLEGLRLAKASADQWAIILLLERLASLPAINGHAPGLARLLGGTQRLREQMGVPRPPAYGAEFARVIATAQRALGASAFAEAWKSGQTLSLELATAAAEQMLEVDSAGSSVVQGPDELSPREREVLSLVAQGLSDAQVADNLVVSRRTVNAHLTTIYRKLGVNSRGAATRYALEHKLV